jgi:hypothetical protein
MIRKAADTLVLGMFSLVFEIAVLLLRRRKEANA